MAFLRIPRIIVLPARRSEFIVADCATIEFFRGLLRRGFHHVARFLPEIEQSQSHPDIGPEYVIQQV